MPPNLTAVGSPPDVKRVRLDVLLVQGFQGDTFFSGISPAWSLSVEVVFYLALPLLALLAIRLGAGRSVRGRVAAAAAPAGLLFAVGIAGELVEEHLVFVKAGYAQLFSYSFLPQADLFAFGMLAAVALAIAQSKRIKPAWVVAVALGGLVSSAYMHTKVTTLGWTYPTQIA